MAEEFYDAVAEKKKEITARWETAGQNARKLSDEDVQRIARAVVRENEALPKPIDSKAEPIGLTAREAERFSLVRAIRAMAFGSAEPRYLRDAAFELEVSEA